MNRSKGFTLIELIIVIIILGILAVTAAPKFIDLKRESIISTMQGITASLNSVATLVHTKALIKGINNQEAATIDVLGQTINIAYGYPDGTVDGIVKLIELSGNWKQRKSSYTGAWVYWHGNIHEDAHPAQCYIRYERAVNATTRPHITFQDNGC